VLSARNFWRSDPAQYRIFHNSRSDNCKPSIQICGIIVYIRSSDDLLDRLLGVIIGQDNVLVSFDVSS